MVFKKGKKMKKLFVMLISLSFLFVLNSFAEESKVTKVELKDIPKEVLAAAKEKVKGFEAKEATVENEKDGKEYEIKGTANGKEVEVEVTVDKDGKVIKTEVETKKADAAGDGD